MSATTAPPSDLTVVGGAGGTRARLEDLETAAVTLKRVAGRLHDAASFARELAGIVDDAARWSPSTAGAAWSVSAPLRSPSDGLEARSAYCRDTADRLRTAAAVYSRAELDAAEQWRRRAVLAGHLFGEAGPRAWAATALSAGALLTLLGGAVVTAGVVLGGPGVTGRLIGAGSWPLWAVGQRLGTVAPLPGPRGAGAWGGAGGQGGRGGALSGVLTVGPWVAPLASVGQVLAALRRGTEDLDWLTGDTVEVAVAGIAAFLRGAGPGRSPLDGSPVPEVAGQLGTVLRMRARLLGVPERGLVVAPLVRDPGTVAGSSASSDQDPPRGVGDVLREVDALYPSGSADGPGTGADHGAGAGAEGVPPGTVGVQRLDHPDGTTSWVVLIPGTQEWSPQDGPNPMDLGTNLDAMAGRPNDVAELVQQAMRAAGVGPDEPVLLAGHSQGGIVAMQLAQDPTIQAEFAVTTVITAGSPVGVTSGELAPGVQALHLENRDDIVWALDGMPNPDDPQRTTVRGSMTDLTSPGSVHSEGGPVGDGLVAAHSAGTYARMGDLADDLDDPSLRAFRASLYEVVGGPGTTASTRLYTGVQVEQPTRVGPSRAGGAW